MLEMVIVMSILAVVALSAVPKVGGQIVRNQVTDALPLINFVKTPLETAWRTTSAFPIDNATTVVTAGPPAVTLPAPNQIVNNWIKSVTVENGGIQIVFGNRANAALADKVLSVLPAVVDAAPLVPVTWVCGHAAPPNGMTLHGTNRTTVDATNLPASCRQ